MEIYIYLLGFVLFCTLLSFFVKRKYLKHLYVVGAVFITGLVAFRHETMGVDTATYCYMFLHPSFSPTDIGFMVYNSILRMFTSDTDVYIAITATLSLVPVFYVVNKDSLNKFFSLFIFVTLGSTILWYVLYFAAMRQCLSVGLLLLLVHLVRAGRIKSLTVIILLNSLIGLVHIAAFLFIPVFLLRNVNFNKYIISGVLVATFILGFNLKQYSSYLLMLSTLTDDRFGWYLGYVEENDYMMLATVPIMLIAVLITMTGSDNMRRDLYFKMFIIGVSINNLLELAADSSRLSFMFLISSCIIIPNYASEKSLNEIVRFAKVALVFCMLSYYSYRFIGIWDKLDPEANMTPYRTNSLVVKF